MPDATPFRVQITCTGRLHMGFLDLHGGLGRHFGSIGLGLDAPRTRIVLTRAGSTQVAGAEQARAERYLEQATRSLDLHGAHALTVSEAIPAHGGLGSGTQLALAIAAGLRILHGLAPDPRGDAALLGRGRRSGIGIGLFQQGGLVVDGGVGARKTPPPLLARLAVPEDWRILLVLDPDAQGLSGGQETEAFATLPPMRAAASGELARLTLLGVLPSVMEADLAGFGRAITRMQEILGDHFAPAQGGRFTSRRVAAAMHALAGAGATGIGQSSWGPTGFAFAQAGAAERLAEQLAATPDAAGLDIMVCRGLNRGAAILVE